MPRSDRWRVVISLLNMTVAGADALHLVVLVMDMSSQRQVGLVAFGLSMLLALGCALSIWLVPKRRVGCSMVVNALVFLLHALAFVVLGAFFLEEGRGVFGLLELSFAADSSAGCVFCRIYSVKVWDEVERKDALEISYEQQKMEQLA